MNKKQSILLDIDALFDTRAGTIAIIDRGHLTDALASGYNERLSDQFKGIDQAAFDRAYAERNVDTIENSVVSGILEFLRTTCNTLIYQAATQPFHTGPRVVVNFFPYELHEEDKKIILNAVRVWLGEDVEIDGVTIDYKYLTPEIITKDYVSLVIYDWTLWCQHHVHRYPKVKIPDFTIITPALLRGIHPSPETLKEIIRESGHPLELAAFTYAGFVKLEFIDVKVFSVFNPLNLNVHDTPK